MKQFCILPIEIGHREAAGVFALSHALNCKGVRAIVLPRALAFQLSKVVGNCFLFFDGARDTGNRYAKLFKFKRRGNKIALLDTEGLLLNDEVLSIRYPTQFWYAFDVAFTWGPKIFCRLKERKPSDSKLELLRTGWPQFLYYRQLHIDESFNSVTSYDKQRILWNTAFPAADIKYNLGKLISDDRVEEVRIQRKKFASLFAQSLELPFASRLRVHPNEKIDFYISEFGSEALEKVKKSSFESILESDLIIADNCTTLIEAAIVGRSCINLKFVIAEKQYAEMDLVSYTWQMEVSVEQNINSAMRLDSKCHLNEILFLPDEGYTVDGMAEKIIVYMVDNLEKPTFLSWVTNTIFCWFAECLAMGYIFGQEAKKYEISFVNRIKKVVLKNYE